MVDHGTGHGIELSPAPKSCLPPTSRPIDPPGRAEFGEIDASENSIDGMGAINFADEEDCGFFGRASPRICIRMSLTDAGQARRPILHSCVIFLEQLQEGIHKVAVFHLYPPHHKPVVGC